MSDYIITGAAMERWDIPAVVTAGEIVRCCDCCFFDHKCDLFEFHFVGMEEMGFCAWGDRKQP